MTVYMFPGQGSQHVGMGSDLFDAYPSLVNHADDVLGLSIKELCLEDPKNVLSKTQYTQPALYIVNALTYQRKLEESGRPSYVVGHSLGEYNALQAAGVISFIDGLKLVQHRGFLMGQMAGGAMAAVLGLSAEALRRFSDPVLANFDIANYNSLSQTVISGPAADMEAAQTVIETAGGMFVPLNTSGAFHSRHMEGARLKFEQFLRQYRLRDPEIPVISNVTAEPYAVHKMYETLGEQLTMPVRWVDSIFT